MARFPKQIQITDNIKARGKTFLGPIKINVNLSGLSGWAAGVANFIADKDGAITQALNGTLSTMQRIMLQRFDQTKGRSRYVKPSSGRTKKSILSGRVFGPDVLGIGKWLLKSYEVESIGDDKYILMQEHGWKRFVDKQPFLRVVNPVTGRSSLRPVKKNQVSFVDENIKIIDVRHPRRPSRRFFLAGLTYWETKGRKDFDRRRLEILRRFIREGNQ